MTALYFGWEIQYQNTAVPHYLAHKNGIKLSRETYDGILAAIREEEGI